nr:hypothetical protein [Caulobacter sp. UNC279MFTsu5.1]
MRFCRALSQIGDVLVPLIDPRLSPIDDAGHQLRQVPWIKEPGFEVVHDRSVDDVHSHRQTAATRRPRSRPAGARIVAVGVVLARAQGHRAAADAAMADAGQQDRTGVEVAAGRFGIAAVHQQTHRLELLPVDDGGDFHDHVFGLVLQFSGLVDPGVEAVLAHVGRPGKGRIDGRNPPAPAITRPDLALVEKVDDALDAHGAAGAVAGQGQIEHQADHVRALRFNLQLALDLDAPLFRVDHPIADWRARPIPEALAGVLLHGAQGMLGVLPGLVFVEQRHHLAHHQTHRIVAELLGYRHQTHAVSGQFARVELKQELVAEEPGKRVHEDRVEGRRLGQARLDHGLETRTLVIGGGVARLDELGHDTEALGRGVGGELPSLIRDREIAVRLAGCGDAKIERGVRLGRFRQLLAGQDLAPVRAGVPRSRRDPLPGRFRPGGSSAR